MIKTYVMHYKKLIERKDFIKNHLLDIGFASIDFIENLDKEELTADNLKYYDARQEKFLLEASATGDAEYRRLKDSEISLCLKHIFALQDFIQSNALAAILLEDDCLFKKVKYNDIEDIVYQAPPKWDMIFLGGGFNHSICKYKGRCNNYLLADNPCTNTSSSIVYSRSGAEKVLKDLTFGISWDWHLNYICKKENMNVYHIYPYIATQNLFISSIQN